MKKPSRLGRLYLVVALCLASISSTATAIRGTLLNGSGAALPKGQLTFTLSSLDANNNRVVGCAAGTAPNIQGGGTISSLQPIPIVAGVGGALLGTVIGNDQINCGGGFGVGTFYHVVATDAGGNLAWTNDYIIRGAIWTPAATPLNVLPPGALPLVALLNPSLSQTITQPGGTSLTVIGTLIATLTGNASTATQLANSPTGCSSNTYATSDDSRANLTCSSIAVANLSDATTVARSRKDTVAFSATPIFDASVGALQSITLTGNVTSSTLTNVVSGQILVFLICQDGVGSRGFTWPANFKGFLPVSTAPNSCFKQSFVYDGTFVTAASAGMIN